MLTGGCIKELGLGMKKMMMVMMMILLIKLCGVHRQRGRVHQEASGKDIYGDGQHFSANSSLVGMSNVSKKHCRCR